MAINSSSVYKINWKWLPSSTWSNICIAPASHGLCLLVYGMCAASTTNGCPSNFNCGLQERANYKSSWCNIPPYLFHGSIYTAHWVSTGHTEPNIYKFRLVNLLLGVIIIVWLVPIGATLLVSSIIARSWLVYRLFVHTFHPGKCLTSYKFPVGFITIFSLVDLILATVVTVLIFYIHYGSHLHIYITVLVFSLFGVMIIIKFATFLTLIILTILTEKVKKQSYSTRPYFFVFGIKHFVVLVTQLCNIFAFEIGFRMVLAAILDTYCLCFYHHLSQ